MPNLIAQPPAVNFSFYPKEEKHVITKYSDDDGQEKSFYSVQSSQASAVRTWKLSDTLAGRIISQVNDQ